MRLIDSSVIVKFFSEEPGWEGLKGYLYTPISIELSTKELSSALLKKVRSKQLEFGAAMQIIGRYPNISRFIEQKRHLGKAFEIAYEHKISFYDSLFIAAAQEQGYELVTCDKRQAEVARKVRVKVITC